MSQLYRHFDESGKLLYVGISLSTVSRLGQHKDNSHWFNRISRVEIAHFATREDALLAERKAVINENPECNINLKKSAKEIEKYRAEIKHQQLVEDVKSQLTGRLVRFEATYSPEEAADLIGMSRKSFREYMDKGTIRSFEVEGRSNNVAPPKIKTKISGWDLIDFIDHLADMQKNKKDLL